MITQAPRGTYDLYGVQIAKWQRIEREIYNLMDAFHYSEIRTPIFEHTELFQRGVGDTTDIVQKEMYTFQDKGGRSITLKPEGTAGAARAFLEHKMFAEAQPTKLFYITPCFRYEKPQAGRDRQFSQFGAELYGSASPMADAEVISVAYELLVRLGFRNVTLRINSLGCSQCRPVYNEKLRQYFAAQQEHLCPTCRERLLKNPLRILDCKDPGCQKIVAGAPCVLDTLDEDCRKHFEKLQEILTGMGISYTVDPGIVRGLDYYTRTVFEFVCNEIGAQGTVCGGGRYDNLIGDLGGDPTPAVGFAAGIGRILLSMEASGENPLPDSSPDLYVGSRGENAARESAALVYRLRQEGVCCESDLLERSVKAQMKYANKIGARYTMILGDDELNSGTAALKNMETGISETVAFQNIQEWRGKLS